ncbi:hypothetical protein ACFVFS_05670 [Kitasatospora sp. NPDC057692]|uniref:hypothetical protein n=1 Tax=Kitasatospora sp. NPDC057692 TaxID=3346215 RepID=UPI00369DED6E
MTVIRVLLREELEANRKAICAWLTANHIDPKHVDPAWISIEIYAGETLIRWKAIKRTIDGRALVDPDNPNQHWTVQLQNRLLVELDLPAPRPPQLRREAIGQGTDG